MAKGEIAQNVFKGHLLQRGCEKGLIYVSLYHFYPQTIATEKKTLTQLFLTKHAAEDLSHIRQTCSRGHLCKNVENLYSINVNIVIEQT